MPLRPKSSHLRRIHTVRPSVEKHPFASAEYRRLNMARAPFLSGVSRLLRCGKDLGQLAEVLGGCGEEKFVICAAWAT